MRPKQDSRTSCSNRNPMTGYHPQDCECRDAAQARDRCPCCQFFNHPDSDVMSGRLRYCVRCGQTWAAEETNECP